MTRLLIVFVNCGESENSPVGITTVNGGNWWSYNKTDTFTMEFGLSVYSLERLPGAERILMLVIKNNMFPTPFSACYTNKQLSGQSAVPCHHSNVIN